MALIYNITFPQDFTQRVIGEPSFFEQTSGLVFTSNPLRSFSISDIRNIDEYGTTVTIPNFDVASTEFVVNSTIKERNVNVNYSITFVGETAKLITKYIKAIRFPGGTDETPEIKPSLEYQFTIEKYLSIEVIDDCCVGVDGGENLVIQGIIPLDSFSFNQDNDCEVTGVIYEDSEKIQILKCLNQTVLGVRSNVGVQVAAEIINDNISQAAFNENTQSDFSTVFAKWFDVCIPPNNIGTAQFLINIVTFIRRLLYLPILSIILILIPLVLTVNLIIAAINVLPGVNITPLPTNPFNLASEIADFIFSPDTMVENVLGCKYTRGGYRVSSVIKAACSLCNLTSVKIPDALISTFSGSVNGNINISYNPFVPNGSLTGVPHPRLKETFNTAYIPAEDAITKRKESEIRQAISNLFFGSNRMSSRDVAIRASSIETITKIFDRLSSLWDTQWNVVKTPVGYQLILGPSEGVYAFDKTTFVEPNPKTVIEYEVPDSTSLTYITEFEQDSNDSESNRAHQFHRGFLNFGSPFQSRNPTSKTYENKVQFAPTMFTGSRRDDTMYDEVRLGEGLLEEFLFQAYQIPDGIIVNSDTFISVPRLVNFLVGETDDRVTSGRSCRVANHNEVWGAPFRMADTYNSILFPGINLSPLFTHYPLPVGIQNKIPLFSTAYRNTERLTVSFVDAEFLAEDYMNKFRGRNNSTPDAFLSILEGTGALLGPFSNLTRDNILPSDSNTYNFSPLVNFRLELAGYECEDLENFLGTIDIAKHKVTNTGLYEIDANYKLSLLKLEMGLGVVEEMQVDYVSKNIKANGFVIPFFQNGIDYSK
jgi:hypothetical protein